MLEADGIVAGFGGQTVLKTDRLEVSSGSRVVLIGTSGSGKTTLLRVLAGLHRPYSGSVQCDGVSRWSSNPRDDYEWVWPDVTMVFQEAQLFPNLTARENCLVGLKTPSDECQESIETWSKLLHVGGLLDRRPWAISQGQRQRFCIIRALVRKPKFLLLDEPMSALDPATRDLVGAFLFEWSSESGNGLVLATHDWLFAEGFGNAFWAIDSGVVSARHDMTAALDDIRGIRRNDGATNPR